MDAVALIFVLSTALTIVAFAYALFNEGGQSSDIAQKIKGVQRFQLLGELLKTTPINGFYFYVFMQGVAPFLFYFWRAPFAYFFAIVVFIAFLAAPQWIGRMLNNRRLVKFDEQLPPFSDQLVASIRGDVPLMISMGAVVPLLEEPIKSEIATLAEQAEKGQGGIDSAIANARLRYESRNYGLLLSVLHIFSRQGGNLVEPMQNMSKSFKQIFRLDKKLQTSAAAARSAFWVINLGLLLIVVLISFARPELIDEIFDTGFGILLLIAGFLVYLLGLVWLLAITKVEI